MKYETAQKILTNLIEGKKEVKVKMNKNKGMSCRTYNALMLVIFDHFNASSAGFNYSNNAEGARKALLSVVDQTGEIVFSSNKITLV